MTEDQQAKTWSPFSAWQAVRKGEVKASSYLRDLPDERPGATPRFSTPLPELDVATRGGVYGVTALVGEPGTGKSLFALGTAFDAALRQDATAVYLAAEMTRQQIEARVMWFAESRGMSRSALDHIYGKTLNIVTIDAEMPWDTLSATVESLLYGSERALLVVDSMNTLLDATDDGSNVWARYRRILWHLIGVRKLTEGALCPVVLSEFNKDGGSRGGMLEHKSDLPVYFKHTGVSKTCKVSITKNRERGEDGPLGEFAITPEGRFQRVGAVQEPEPTHPGEW